MRSKILIGFDNFGNYHLARINSLTAHFDVVAIEMKSKSTIYDWVIPNEAYFAFKKITLFDGSSKVSLTGIIKKLNKIISDESFSFALIPGWESDLAFCMLQLCEKKGIKPILMSESQEDDSKRSVFKEFIKKLIVSRFNMAMVGGMVHELYLRKLGFNGMIAYGYNIVDNQHFRNASDSNQLGFLKDDNYVLISSRLVERKNIRAAIQVWSQLTQRDDLNFKVPKLYICGSGPDRVKLESLVNELNLNQYVFFKGFVAYEEMPYYYQNALFLLHPSKTEQWGLVVNEAMAAGCPVAVSCRCGSARSMVIPKFNGEIFEPFSLGSLENVIIEMMDPEQRRLYSERSKELVGTYEPTRFGAAVVGLVSGQNTSISDASFWSLKKILYRLLPIIWRLKRNLSTQAYL